jgi:hypothetical protein
MNSELKRLFEADQNERVDHPHYGTPEYLVLRDRDRQRCNKAAVILNAIEKPVAEDFHHAAMIFQHGESIELIWQAHEYAMKAAKLGYRPARWLAAAAYDRWLMYQGRPQKFGTQFVPDGKRHRLWDVEPDTTDEERNDWDVPNLAQQKKRAEELSRTEPIPPMTEAPDWLKDAIKRWNDSNESL